MSQKINFTKESIEALPNAAKGKRDFYYDAKTPALGVMVFPSGTKTFFFYKRVDGKPDKIKLGRFPEKSIEQAKKEATKALNDVNHGINPRKEKQRLRDESSFGELFERYMETHARERKRSWQIDEGYYKNHLQPALDKKKISTIMRIDVEKLHNSIKSKAGLYAANRVLALLKTIFNKAIDWGFAGPNPASGVKKFKEISRDRALQPDEVGRFIAALNDEPNLVLRGYFYISLLTGARRNNVLTMRWQDVNLTDALWRIPMTKNGDPQTVVLAPQAVSILRELHNLHESDWVFPSETSASGHIEEPKRAWKRLLDRSEISDLRIHDLRRTLASWQVRTGANSFVIGKTLGHKSQQATAIYAQVSKDVTRDSVENAVNAMLGYSKQKNKE